MVFGDSKTGKTTLIERLLKRKLKVSRRSQHSHHGISIKHWLYAPTSCDNAVKFMIWDFNNQVNHQLQLVPELANILRINSRIFVEQHITVSIRSKHSI